MAANSKQKLPETSNYTPLVTDSQSESQLREPGISFKVNLKRARLFSSLTFVVQTEKELESIALPIQLAGGKSRLWSPDDDLESISQQGVVSVLPPSSIRSSQSQAASEWKRVSSHLSSKNLATSPATHIYLAIVHCSTATFCNPRRQTASVLPQQPPAVVEGKVRALETQESASPFVKPTSGAGVKPKMSGASRAPNSSVSTLLSDSNESQTLMGQDSASPFIKPTPGAGIKSTSSTNIRTLSSDVTRAAEASLSSSTMSSAAQSSIFSLKTQPTPAAQPNPLQGAAPPTPTPPLFSSTSTAAECMEVIDLDQEESQDNLATSNPSRKRTRDDEAVDTRGAKKGRGEVPGKENMVDDSNSENSADSSRQKLDLRVSGFEESCKSSSLEGGQRHQPGHNVNNMQQKSADMFDTSPMKSTLATQTKDSTLQSQSTKRPTTTDDEDVFGFGDQPGGGGGGGGGGACIK